MKLTTKLKQWFVLCIALLIPLSAVAENMIVPLPTAVPLPTPLPQADPYAFHWEGYYDGYDVFMDNQVPHLLAGEKLRVPALQAEYDTGRRPADSVLNLTENVRVGVYALPADQYQGEAAYLLLPTDRLTDEELLAIIDAYAALGLRFDPDALNANNCMRGGGHECTRSYYTAEERARNSVLLEQWRRSGLRPESPLTPLPGDDGIGVIGLDAEAYSGLPDFTFLPARRLTDEELLQLLSPGQDADTPAADYAAGEAKIRTLLHRRIGLPLSAKLVSEGFGKESDYSVFGSDRRVYFGSFEPAAQNGAWYCHGQFAPETGRLVWAVYICADHSWSEERGDPADPRWAAIARGLVQGFSSDDADIAAVESLGEVDLQYAGYGVELAVSLTDGGRYTVALAYQDERAARIEYTDAARTASMDKHDQDLWEMNRE